ncbi:variable surface protein [Plasmodium gonderi]|uniref:Variable surface protein n=1 Tax=Plasmodium gonderi TaxID=77519 RepID=A0A1Y1JTR5_PLAGO|nr:variable surface protein [Plasmodium gonderi]GAW84152.1 variable surface protein [Plasmodium gonderi]
MTRILVEANLNGFPSKAYYTRLEGLPDLCFQEPKKEEVKGILESIVEIKYNSQKILNSFCDLSYVGANTDKCFKECDRLYYWIGDMLYNKLGSNDEFYSIFNKLQDGQNMIGSSGQCKCKFPKGVNTDDFETMKTVYDYSLDNATIKEELNEGDISCDEYYMSHLRKYVNKYNDVFRACVYGKTKTYCDEFKRHYPSYMTEIMSNLKFKFNDQIIELIHLNVKTLKLEEKDEIPSASATIIPVYRTFKAFILTVLSLVFVLIFFFFIYKYNPLGTYRRNFMEKYNTIRRYLNDINMHKIMECNFYLNQKISESDHFNLAYYTF